MITNLTIRPRSGNDDAFLCALDRRLFPKHRPDWLYLLLGKPGVNVSVAVADGLPVGYYVLMSYVVTDKFGPWRRPVSFRLRALGVHPDHQGQRTGRSLLEAAEASARRQQDGTPVALNLVTSDANYKARGLFESSGYLRMIMSPDRNLWLQKVLA